MFTGIIEHIGTVASIAPFGKGRRLSIATKSPLEGLKTGDSVAINGVCLTVVEVHPEIFVVEAVQETLTKSTIGEMKTGQHLNLERAMPSSGRLDGHFVLGHVDTISKIDSISKREESWWIGVAFQKADSRLLIPRGSIAIDGASMTIAEKHNSIFFPSSRIPIITPSCLNGLAVDT